MVSNFPNLYPDSDGKPPQVTRTTDPKLIQWAEPAESIWDQFLKFINFLHSRSSELSP